MKKLKYLISLLIVLGGLFFLFGPEVIPENFQPEEILNEAKNSDVVIIFNSGGWGDTPLEEAKDFAPVIAGIQETLYAQGYNSVVIPFNRTKNTFLGKVAGAKDFFSSFNSSSEILAEDLEILSKNLPDKKIILAGLSSGATFINKTYEKVSEEVKGSVYAIAAGTPFWAETVQSDKILQLDNNGKDSLVEGKAKSLLLSAVKAPFKWVFSKIIGQNLKFSQAFQSPGHNYPWSSPEVSSQIATFLKEKF